MFKAIARISGIVASAGVFSGCKLIVLNPKGMIASQEVRILGISVFLMLLVVLPVIFLSLFFSWRYRETNSSVRYAPAWSHSTLLEVIWWSIPCAIIAVLGTITWISSHTLDPYRPITTATESPVRIQVIALQWKWLFIYPDQQIATVNFVQFPVNVPIRFEVTSAGPMNSFLIPQLAGQVYAMAGMRAQLNLIANEAGDYPGLSANFSGAGFSGMKFTARASSRQAFEQWVADVRKTSLALNKYRYEQLLVPSQNDRPAYYRSVDSYLFRITLMKSMMPEKEAESLCRERAWA